MAPIDAGWFNPSARGIMRGFIVYADMADVFIRTQQIHIINTEKISLIIRAVEYSNRKAEPSDPAFLQSTGVYALLFLKLGLSLLNRTPLYPVLSQAPDNFIFTLLLFIESIFILYCLIRKETVLVAVAPRGTVILTVATSVSEISFGLATVKV